MVLFRLSADVVSMWFSIVVSLNMNVLYYVYSKACDVPNLKT